MVTLARTSSIIPVLGVIPPSIRSPHSSTRWAPPRSAATAEATESTHISIRIPAFMISRRGSRGFPETLISLSDAKRAEDQVEDVVGGGGPGDGIERPQSVIEIEQQHLVRDFGCHGSCGGIESGERVLHQALVADVCKKSSFSLRSGFATDVVQDFGAQLRNALASQSRGTNFAGLTTGH